MRTIETPNFEETNVEYIEFWLMDPFIYNTNSAGGKLYINLGDISEDVLLDHKKAFENGLPTSPEMTGVDSTQWGVVPKDQALVNSFDANLDARKYQDVGYDGLTNDNEKNYFNSYLQSIASIYGTGSVAYQLALNDPSSANYHYFRGTDYDDLGYNILQRYKYYKNSDGNSPTPDMSNESYPTSATNNPNSEDINRDNTLNELERYYQYEINLNQPILEKKDGRYDIFIRKKVEGQTISYAITTNQSLLSDDIPNFQRMIWLLILFTVPLMALVIWIFYRFISKPISAMIEASQKIESGEIGYQIQPLPDSNEFNYLTERFNSMSHQLKVQFERSYQEQIALQDARIKALQSQIDPHFLNNTLETINWEARISGDEKVSNMIEALSTMLSAATARGGETMISLAEELTYVNAYLYIISVRFGKRLSVKKEIDETLLGEKVPRLVMQPIVENAIEHGIAPHRNGDLILRIYRQEEKIVMEVENSGESVSYTHLTLPTIYSV